MPALRWLDGEHLQRISAKLPPYRLRSIKPALSISLSHKAAPTLPSIEEAIRQGLTPFYATHGGVRWPRIDPAQWVFDELRVSTSNPSTNSGDAETSAAAHGHTPSSRGRTLAHP